MHAGMPFMEAVLTVEEKTNGQAKAEAKGEAKPAGKAAAKAEEVPTGGDSEFV